MKGIPRAMAKLDYWFICFSIRNLVSLTHGKGHRWLDVRNRNANSIELMGGNGYIERRKVSLYTIKYCYI
jgi:hypothetical protein